MEAAAEAAVAVMAAVVTAGEVQGGRREVRRDMTSCSRSDGVCSGNELHLNCSGSARWFGFSATWISSISACRWAFVPQHVWLLAVMLAVFGIAATWISSISLLLLMLLLVFMRATPSAL